MTREGCAGSSWGAFIRAARALLLCEACSSESFRGGQGTVCVLDPVLRAFGGLTGTVKADIGPPGL